MVTPRRSVTERRWTRGFIVAFLAIAAAVLLTAQPVRGEHVRTTIIDVKDNEGK